MNRALLLRDWPFRRADLAKAAHGGVWCDSSVSIEHPAGWPGLRRAAACWKLLVNACAAACMSWFSTQKHADPHSSAGPHSSDEMHLRCMSSHRIVPQGEHTPSISQQPAGSPRPRRPFDAVRRQREALQAVRLRDQQECYYAKFRGKGAASSSQSNGDDDEL